jgi:hypothetical protein
LAFNLDKKKAGKTCVSKERVEGIDKKNNKITYRELGGDLLKDYKSMKMIMQVVPQKVGGVVHWIVEYEKLNNNGPNPHSFSNYCVEVLKRVDAHLAPDQYKK